MTFARTKQDEIRFGWGSFALSALGSMQAWLRGDVFTLSRSIMTSVEPLWTRNAISLNRYSGINQGTITKGFALV
jgi:hypothetical protein